MTYCHDASAREGELRLRQPPSPLYDVNLHAPLELRQDCGEKTFFVIESTLVVVVVRSF